MALIETTHENTTEDARVHMLCNALCPEDPLRYCASVSLRHAAQSVDAPALSLLLDILGRPLPRTLDASYSRRYVVRWLLGGSKIHPEYTPREVAAWALGHVPLPPQDKIKAVSALINTMREPGGRKASIQIINICRGWLRGWLLFMAIYGTVFFTFAFGSGHLSLATLGLVFGYLLLGCAIPATLFSPLFVGVTLRQTNQHRNKMRVAAAQSLGRLAASEGLGVLADALRDRPGEVQSAAIVALPAVVAALAPEWYGRMPAGTTRDVCRALQCTSIPGHTRLLLVQALEVVGDGSGARDVEALLAAPQPLYADRDGIKERLHALLPLLRERLRSEQDDALLLRGSQQTLASQDQLLRASMPQSALQSPEQLLRAVEGQDTAP